MVRGGRTWNRRISSARSMKRRGTEGDGKRGKEWWKEKEGEGKRKEVGKKER